MYITGVQRVIYAVSLIEAFGGRGGGGDYEILRMAFHLRILPFQDTAMLGNNSYSVENIS